MFKNWMRQVFLQRGVFLQRATREEDIEGMLRLTRPVTTDKKLLRIGGEWDGGYLVPDDLEGIRYCFSPGVSTTATFEADLAGRGIESFMADYSVPGPPLLSPMFHFERKFLGACNNDVFMTLRDWMSRNVPETGDNLLLQMDIEGGEYDVIFDTPESTWKRFRILVVEFHFLNAVFEPVGLRMISLCLSKLLEVFDLVHIHPNNRTGSSKRGGIEIPAVAEFTFLRKDRVARREFTQSFPHPLDRPNVPGMPDLILPKCFYSVTGR
jgi:hypothetical protein